MPLIAQVRSDVNNPNSSISKAYAALNRLQSSIIEKSRRHDPESAARIFDIRYAPHRAHSGTRFGLNPGEKIYYDHKIRVQGPVVELSCKKAEDVSGRRVGTKSRIKGFSKRSRNNAIKQVNAINFEAMGGCNWVTFTMPGEFDDWDPKHWEAWKEALDKRIERRFPGIWCSFWKKEPQRRGAPHYSYFLWCAGINFMDKDENGNRPHLEWLKKSWYEVVGSQQGTHLRAGVHCEWVDASDPGLITYMTKYQTKDEKGGVVQEFNFEAGRYWGFVKKNRIKFHDVQELKLSPDTYYKALRVIRGLYRAKARALGYKRSKGVSFLNPGAWKIMNGFTISQFWGYVRE